ncbi:MAG: ABC-2 family transporter protein [Ardenticatenaceae bacterium]|nr:ABC-2 family transporter protein [Ardenticatenaceae bacterium]
MNSLRVLWIFLRVGIMNEAQYRVNFFVQLLQSAIALATGLIVLALVFSYTESLNSWSQPELLIVMGVHTLMGGLIQVIIQPNMLRLMREIQEGTLDYMLTKPEDSQVLVSVRELRFWSIVDVAVGLAIVGWGMQRLASPVTLAQVLLFLLMLGLGFLIFYSFWLLVASTAFWFIRISEIVTIFQSLFQAGRWPVGIYPVWLRTILTFVVPLGVAVTVPAEAFTNRLSTGGLFLAVGVTALFFGASRGVWLWGLRNYSGASA